jgi:hypothetical protein
MAEISTTLNDKEADMTTRHHHDDPHRKYMTRVAVNLGTVAVVGLTTLGAFGGVGAARATAAPAASCGQSNYKAWLSYNGGDNTYYCATGISPLGPVLKSQLAVRAPDRIWLHQTYPASGWADCFWTNLGSGVPFLFPLSGTRDDFPGDLQVTTNTAACPAGGHNGT